jgi:tetratricopeptide (TPR) repeat protein
MNSKHLLAATALLVVFVVLPLVLLLGKPFKAEPPPVDPEALNRVQERMTALEKDLTEFKDSLRSDRERLQRALEGLNRLAASTGVGGAAPHGRAGAGDDEASGEVPASAAGRAASRGASSLTVEAALAALTDRKLSWDEKEKLWKRIREAGLTDDVIKEFEKRVAANPKDPDAQTDLGNAYLKKIQEVPQGPEAGKWAIKADEAFDKALELNPEHWDSRFMKATALSFWPAVFGKQGEAVKHYETLVAQQERQTAREGFAETYYYLGNMYQQMGKIDQAVSTWQRGLRLFPDNAHLLQQIANSGSLPR